MFGSNVFGGPYFGQGPLEVPTVSPYAAEPREFFAVDPVDRWFRVPAPEREPDVAAGFDYFRPEDV